MDDVYSSSEIINWQLYFDLILFDFEYLKIFHLQNFCFMVQCVVLEIACGMTDAYCVDEKINYHKFIINGKFNISVLNI